MSKRYRIILISSVAVVLALIALIIVLLVKNGGQEQRNGGDSVDTHLQLQVDSLQLANETLQLSNEFTQIDAEFMQHEGQQVVLKNDSLVQKYDESRRKVQQLIKQLNQEKMSHNESREKIKQLEAEISTLRGICRHYLEEIARLSKENEGLKEENSQLTQRNEELTSQVSDQAQRNQELTQVVQRAEKLNVTGISLRAYNKNGKEEKNVTKARKLGVSFTISPNNTAKAGVKDLYIRIITPEGTLLRGNGSFSYEGKQLPYSAKRSVEYTNDELSTSVYCDVSTSLTAGDYTVEIFCDGNRLASRRFTLRK